MTYLLPLQPWCKPFFGQIYLISDRLSVQTWCKMLLLKYFIVFLSFFNHDVDNFWQLLTNIFNILNIRFQLRYKQLFDWYFLFHAYSIFNYDVKNFLSEVFNRLSYLCNHEETTFGLMCLILSFTYSTAI
jgi:hypothetical protein